MKVLDSKEVKIRLDKKDREIMFYLCKNVRLPTSKIAKLVKMSRENVHYRLSKLKEHIITGEISAINTKKLGFLSTHIFVELCDQSKKEKEQTINLLKKNPNINVIVTYSGKYNLEIGIFAKTINEIYEIKKNIFSQIGTNDNISLMIGKTIKTNIMPQNYFSDLNLPDLNNTNNDSSFHKDFIKSKIKDYKIDDIDQIIIKEIGKNSCMKIKDLARVTRLTYPTVKKRIVNLIRNNIIIDFRPAINFYALGLNIQTLLLRFTGKGFKDLNNFENFIKSNNNIIWATHSIGGGDMLIYLLSENLEDYHAFIEELRNDFPDYIKSHESLFAFEEHKYLFFPESL